MEEGRRIFRPRSILTSKMPCRIILPQIPIPGAQPAPPPGRPNGFANPCKLLAQIAQARAKGPRLGSTPPGPCGWPCRPKGRVPQLEFTGTEAAANARARGLGAIDPEAHAAEMVADTLMNIREARVAALVHNLNTYAADKRVTLSGTSQFSDYPNSESLDCALSGATTMLSD